jgi:hypothetical protein
MKIPTKNFFQRITGKVGHMNTAAPQGLEMKKYKRELSIDYLLDGACKRSNSAEKGGEKGT